MSQVPVKKRSRCPQHATPPPVHLEDPVRFPDTVLCLVEKRMGASRRAFLTSLARRRGFCVEGADSKRVTHVVSEGNSGDEVMEWMKRKGSCWMDALGSGPALLDLSWFTESMSAGQPVEIEPRHRLGVTIRKEEPEGRRQVAAYICQRRTPLAHCNQALTVALETMAEEARFCSSEGRSLAFSRAASVLKSLPWAVRRVQELSALPCIGEHSKKIIQEVLEDGTSAEVESIKQSERYQTMELFTQIFGVGVKTASRWYREGLRTLADLKAQHTKLSREQQAGLQHFEDLQIPVVRSEAEAIGQVVQKAVEQFLPGASVTLTGGFRRGKQSGHDVDLLITHPEEGQEGLLLYHSSQRNTFYALEEQEMLDSSTSTMDRFERSFSIFRLDYLSGGIQRGAGSQEPGSIMSGFGATRSWKAVRLDLVVTPYSQFSFALLGWTGSKNFERDLRRFCKQEKKMALNSHALYHMEQKIFLAAASEEEIFQHLGLEYIPPEERNA
ncbi:DNA-directed DNA/RNA polymerase mu isoform X2 [Hemicordylus capensis]|uniref:DNA-directed DNA/RNA polymerase mu isoform X2 n=1 Tax=Hemicordylus capensis TaxID=884348 RepID=UPI0023048850|nr:DNA-directed DNA/RNA polymerase mu isoform X2 [Hemicordylus capensis]